MRWLNYQHLFYFWHVARCGSVTEAAAQLRLAQPTISAQLRSFEDVLGEKLLERDGRGLRLTEVGRLAHRYADQIFTAGQEFLDALDGKPGGARRELKVGIADVVPKSIAYRLIEPAFSPDTGAMVHCLEDKTEKLLAQLSIGEVDLVIADRPLPPNVKVKAFNHFIGSCGVSFLGVRTVAAKYKRNFPKSLHGAPLLLPTADSAVRHELNHWFDKLEIAPECVGSFQDRALMKLAARNGKGIVPVPSVVEAEVRREFHLDLVGRSTEIKEEIYVISIEKRLKNPLVLQICVEGQGKLFSRSN
jgi:LysR family transcriptional activator of nhaA